MSGLPKESSFCSEASTSQEGQEEEAPGLDSNRTLRVTLLSSEWKSSKGGLSTINRELAIQLAKQSSLEVSVYLPQCSEEDKKVARSQKVQLIEADKLPGYDPVDWLAFVPVNHTIDCIIGHGVHLGRQIPLIKRQHHCKWIQVVHTAPEELGMFKSYADAISKGEKKHQTEIELCELADQVVAVGPKLADAYSRYLRSCQKDRHVFTLTPGIFTEFSEVKQATEERNTFCVLVFGRGDSEDFELKGYDIAVQAVAKLKETYQLRFVGAPSGKENEVKDKLLQYGISPSQLTVRCFVESREWLAKLLCEVDLAIMPSRTEGFGLTALEALSAGLPILVSGNSGLGEAFKKVPFGLNWIVTSEDPEDWAEKIRTVRERDRDIRLEEYELFREKYGVKYNWQKQCCCLVEKMRNISFASLGISVECINAKLKEPSSQNGTSDLANSARIKEGTERTVTAVTNDAEAARVCIPKSEEILRVIAMRRLEIMPPSNRKEFDDLREYLTNVRSLLVQDVQVGSLLITVKCRSLQVLEDLWTDYTSGYLNEMVQKCLVTEDVLNVLGLSELTLNTTIREDDYKACRRIFQESVVMSPKEGEHSTSQRTKSDPRRQTNAGAEGWHDNAVSANYQKEVIKIPKDKAALVIGKKEWRRKDIMERSGVKKLSVKEGVVHLGGTREQCARARKIIDMIFSGEDNPDQGSWKKLDFIHEKYMGPVIGRNRVQLNDIEQKTGATLKVSKRGSNSSLYIKGSTVSQKRVIRKIKEIVYILMRQSHSGKRTVRLVHVDTTQLDLNHEFELYIIPPPNAFSSDERIYKLKQLEYSSQLKDLPPGFAGVENLEDKLLMVLKKLHEEKEEERVIVDIWCHLGHGYITEVDEADEGEIFTLAEIKEKLEDEKPGWRSMFKGGLENIEVEHIEKHLESRAAKEEIRYDFTFFTPSCRYVRVKAWLSEKAAEQEGDEPTSMAFSRSAPFNVMSVMSHELPDEEGDSSHKPCFYMCSQTQQRMKADILMVSEECDYRLFIKTSPIGLVSRTPQAEEEDKILASYLMGMKINEGELTLPPVSERPDGFDLFYQRRSRRRVYEYEMDGVQFSLLVSKYQEKRVDPAETDANGFDEIAIETDIHLHCKEWDRLLEEGNWEPMQIVAKLPSFLQFLRLVQRNVAP